MIEQGQRMLKRTGCRSHQQAAESIAKFCVAFRLAQQQSIESFMEWVSMAKQLQSLTSPSAMQSGRCSVVKHAATGLQSSTCLTALCQV
ncbi:unnamed protein product [Staurois parvus]|uniref:Uncharacterized protein n=1 Tax=Staurois parvus TaxID=386267 RepID=A0ABN9GRF5_9NEOB|nr:unnamed protein product [Staurois parvus]